MADIGYKTQLYVGSTTLATTATVKLAAVTSVTPPGLSLAELERTNMDDTDYVRRYMPGLVDPGTVQLELQWTPSSATDDLMRTMLTGREVRYWEVQFNGLNPIVKFGGKGFLTEYTPGAATPEGELTATATIRPSDGIWAEVS